MKIGSVVAQKYRLTRPIGRGGMGSVFEATHVSTGKRVAVKVMHARRDDDTEDEKARTARFQREALAVGQLETEHVVQVFDAGVDHTNHEPFIVMQFLEGEDISRLLKRLGPLPMELSLAIVAQACAGLARAHDAGVIHRDIKPGNIFLARNEHGEHVVKVLDFGVAKVTRADERMTSEVGTITETGMLVGSPHYMSPEQAKALKTMDHRADLWSLGIVLHKCLTGRTPFDQASTLGQIIVAVCSEDFPSVQVHAPWVPGPVAEIVRRALERDPSRRFQSASEMLEAIRAQLPDGLRITDSMVAPLPDHLRAQLPHGFVIPDSTPNFNKLPNEPRSDPDAATLAASGTDTAIDISITDLGRPPRKTGSIIAAGIVLVMIGVSLVAWRAIHRVPPVHDAAVTVATTTATTTNTTSEPSATPSAEPVAAASSTSPAAIPSASASSAAKTRTPTKPVVGGRPPSRPTPTSSGPGRLQGGVGGDVPF